ncbi:MAG: nuclear transport factor 2 family protein [Gemmatimonadota bacterium]|nr:nuclear transport factor 2 family protein [Gemmatimonadota bacterium]
MRLTTSTMGIRIGLAGVLALAGQVAAQEDVRPEDVSTIDGIMKAYYEVVSGPAGERADVERDRTLHHPEAWIAIAGADDDGTAVVRVMTLDEFYGSNQPRQRGFWEWETDRVERRSGNMVSVWSSYAASETEDGEPHTTGVNAVTLFWDGTRWWIMNWMYDSTAG